MKIDLEGIQVHSNTSFELSTKGIISFELNNESLSLSFKNEKGDDVTALLPKQELKAFNAILQNFVNEIGE